MEYRKCWQCKIVAASTFFGIALYLFSQKAGARRAQRILEISLGTGSSYMGVATMFELPPFPSSVDIGNDHSKIPPCRAIMSLLICSLSNTATEEPVVSPVSGRIFDRTLILKYLEHNAEDPIVKLPLSPDMLIEVKADLTASPKLPTYSSIPVLLQALQKEWDAMTLHSFTLRQQLQAARQELSHSLYQQDAACRVIARLTKEVSAAREALATLKPQAAVNTATAQYQNNQVMNDSSMPVEAEIPTEVIKKLEETAANLTRERKLRGKKLPERLWSSDKLKEYRCVESHIGFHSASNPGILSMDVCAFNASRFLTGGKDKVANVFDKDLETTIAVFKGHTKKITRVVYHFREFIEVKLS
ncbi:hypothetical protein GJ496_011383 [Pomphorhynchus laevis]|nr:hypothetical protein GJ496_011383 [Pomphorhynchus laevis]